ncbi:MAG: hypothetical protein K6E50_01550 [Lachnospiraceae bacterium]|nr:hypothetical protein [Lachnospiraceae bacterium]
MTKEERIPELHRRVEQRRRKKEAGKSALIMAAIKNRQPDEQKKLQNEWHRCGGS